MQPGSGLRRLVQLSAVGSIGSAPGDVLLEFSNKHEGLVNVLVNGDDIRIT